MPASPRPDRPSSLRPASPPKRRCPLAVVERLLAEDYSLRDLSGIVLTDQVIAAQALRQANSTAFGGERWKDPRGSVQELTASLTPGNLIKRSAVRTLGLGPTQAASIIERVPDCLAQARELTVK